VHHRLHAGPDRLKSSQSQQVEGCRPERGHRPSSIAPVAVGILVELGVANPVPALNAPAVSHQLQQGFWGGPQAGEESVRGLERLAAAGADRGHLHDPAGAAPGLADVLRCLFGAERPGDGTTMALFENTCLNRDVAFPLELAPDLAMQGLLVPLDGQEEVGPLLQELLKNGFWVWRASAWISTPSRSSSPSSCFSTALSWSSPVA
jgi:hypothetical protein